MRSCSPDRSGGPLLSRYVRQQPVQRGRLSQYERKLKRNAARVLLKCPRNSGIADGSDQQRKPQYHENRRKPQEPASRTAGDLIDFQITVDEGQ